jgi:hypothetical protein
VIDINKGRENFYPDESKELFINYIEAIKELRNNLKIAKKNLIKSFKK